MSDQQPATIALTVSFRGTSHTINLPLSSQVYTLHAQLEGLTGVPPMLQKLLYQGKRLFWKSDEDARSTTLEQAGLRDGTKMHLLGSMLKGFEGPKKEESEHVRRERIIRERALKAPVTLRSTGPQITTLSTPSVRYRFDDIQALAHLPNSSAALSVLQKLASDPAIKHIMEKHRFSVGLLSELAPQEDPELLGLNLTSGVAILLRVRTNACDGFRSYSEVRRVLCHELTHNVFDLHDENFNALDAQLSREVIEYEQSIAQSAARRLDAGEMNQPLVGSSSELAGIEARVYFVQGDSGSSSSVKGSDFSSESLEERRRKILEAAMKRLKKTDS